MKYISLLIYLTIFLFNCLPTQACPLTAPEDTDYMRRDENRCEGIKNQNIAGGIRLISLVIRGIEKIANADSMLNLKIPRISGSHPDVRLRSSSESRKNYQLDRLLLQPESSYFTFSWPARILWKVEIPITSLYAVAKVTQGSQEVYVPVTIGKPVQKYEFVLSTSTVVENFSFQILRNGKPISPSRSITPLEEEVTFTWDGLWNGKSAPAGQYQLSYQVKLDRLGKRKPIDGKIPFEHNPNWLK